VRCNFCNDPAVHDSTGSRYGSRMLACYACTVRFWKWALQHINRPARKNGADFYEAAGKWRMK
jgi:hypothetical protein